MGVRFIAITDHYDSAAGSDDADQIIVPFKNLINDAYCRDISIKIQWTLLGVNKREIADRLNLLGVATPGQKEKRKIARVPLEETKWNGGTVRKILENPTYSLCQCIKVCKKYV